MNKFKEKLELIFAIARIELCIPSAAFVFLFAVISTELRIWLLLLSFGHIESFWFM